MNGFGIQSDLDAQIDRQVNQQGRVEQDDEGSRVSSDATKISNLDEGQSYSVFITFIEVSCCLKTPKILISNLFT